MYPRNIIAVHLEDKILALYYQFDMLTDEAKDALKNEKIKRVTADMLLMKLYKELQKLKLVTQTGRQVKKLEDLQSDITMLEQRKLALEKSVPIPQISSFEQISAKIDRQAFSFKRRCLFSLVF